MSLKKERKKNFVFAIGGNLSGHTKAKTLVRHTMHSPTRYHNIGRVPIGEEYVITYKS